LEAPGVPAGRAQGRYEEPEPLLIEALNRPRLRPGDTHPDTQESLSNLIAFYEALNKLEEAEKWRAKLPQAENTRK